MKKLVEKNKRRAKRKLKIRSRISGTAVQPRLSVFKSNSHISVQAVDDVQGHTLMAASTVEVKLNLRKNKEDAKKLGLEFGKRLKEKNIGTAVFDRNGFKYHGVIASLADGIREAGIQF